MQGPDWRGMKGMRRFIAASSTGAAWNIGNSFAVEKTVRDVGEEVCVCVCVCLCVCVENSDYRKTLGREDLVFDLRGGKELEVKQNVDMCVVCVYVCVCVENSDYRKTLREDLVF